MEDVDMDAVKLGQRQIFLMKKENLTKRVQDFYTKNQNIEHLIQYMVAILVRNSFSKGTFTEQLKDLIREVYLTLEPNDTMRRYSPFFKTYFNGSEWKELVKKLFKNKENYFAYTEEARFYTNFLEQAGTLTNCREGLVYHVESVFEDADGKKHKLTIPDVAPTKDEELTANILRALSTLTVFENAGVRKFVEFVSYKTPGLTIASSYNNRKVEKAAELQASTAEKQPVETTAKNLQPEKEPKQGTKKTENQTVVAEAPPNQTKKTYSEESLSEWVALSQKDSNSNRAAEPPENPTSDKLDEQSTADTSKKKRRKSTGAPQKPDASYNRFGKSKTQIDNDRKNRYLKREVDKQNGKKKRKKKRK